MIRRGRSSKGVSFEVPAGKTVAIVGPSGAGQIHDLAAAVPVLRHPVGQHRHRRAEHAKTPPSRACGRRSAWCPQDTVLFNDTIAYNIRYGRIGASDDEVQKGGRPGADLGDFIESLPEGFQCDGRRAGTEAVGWGEAARGDCPHDPQGAADPDPRRGHFCARYGNGTGNPGGAGLRLQGADHGGDRAPSVDRGRSADEIIVLQERREIAERGRHAELLAQKGLYASMWDRQREATEAEEQLKRMREEDEMGVVTRRRTPEIGEA
jgi:ABC-type transport system involved in cytochrome bd biosynthesis fused ATPase/permease subunit